jgi:hypothetical protein
VLGIDELRGEPSDGRALSWCKLPAVEQWGGGKAINAGWIALGRMLAKIGEHVDESIPH